MLHDDSSLLLPNNSHTSIGYDINDDAKNVQLPGTMWGMHYDIKQIIYSHIENLCNDKIVLYWFTSTIPQVNKCIIGLIIYSLYLSYRLIIMYIVYYRYFYWVRLLK